LFQLERDGRMVRAGIATTEKQISFRYKRADENAALTWRTIPQD
jgi:hypothetical protein